MDNETICFEAWRIQLASLILLFLILVIACARHPGQAAAPPTSQAQKTASTTPASVQLKDTGEQTITWEEQGMKFTFPAGWRKNALLGQGPENVQVQRSGWGHTLN
jgi:hypothetical protein